MIYIIQIMILIITIYQSCCNILSLSRCFGPRIGSRILRNPQITISLWPRCQRKSQASSPWWPVSIYVPNQPDTAKLTRKVFPGVLSLEEVKTAVTTKQLPIWSRWCWWPCSRSGWWWWRRSPSIFPLRTKTHHGENIYIWWEYAANRPWWWR